MMKSEPKKVSSKKTTTKISGKGSGASARFFCGACRKLAATVYIVPAGTPDPRLTPEPEGAPPGISLFDIDETRLSIEGGPVSYTMPVGSDSVGRVKSALLTRNAAALYAIDEEYAPFWCPSCRRSYCRKHYRSVAAFDDGFFDCYCGTCPSRHRRVLCD